MAERIDGPLCRLLRIPPQPHPPLGSEGSVRTFRASKSYYHYRLFQWGLKQLGALFGIAFLLLMQPAWVKHVPWGAIPLPDKIERGVNRVLMEIAGDDEPADLGDTLFFGLEMIGLAVLLAQMPITFLMVGLDYRMRWYILTDRSLRIREGVGRIREMTMTFANVQNLAIQQGPVQRLLGISDLKVRTAGGGGDSSGKSDQHDDGSNSMHVGYFRGVDDAEQIRDEMIRRLRQYRSSGLGDPDDTPERPAAASHAPAVMAPGAATIGAARQLLAEVRALRGTLAGQGG